MSETYQASIERMTAEHNAIIAAVRAWAKAKREIGAVWDERRFGMDIDLRVDWCKREESAQRSLSEAEAALLVLLPAQED